MKGRLRNIVLLTACSLLLNTFLGAQNESDGLVKWISLKEAQEKNKTWQKPFLIDFYTSWCGWCKHMMKTTYSNPAIANYINTNFYAVKFDAEGKDTVEYNGKIYRPLSNEPKVPHELAIKFLGNSLSYPSTVFVTNNYEYTLLTQGYLDEKKIEPLLVFLVENAWRTSVYEEFSRYFQRAFYDSSWKKVPVKLYSYKEVEKLSAKKPKKILVNIGTGFCNSCRIMTRTTWCDSLVGEYINKNFYVMNFDAETADTILFKKEKHYKTVINGYPFNTLTYRLVNNRFSLPAVAILDEQMNTLEVLNYYQSPAQLKPILKYFAEDIYRKKAWPDFIKEYSTAPPSPKSKK